MQILGFTVSLPVWAAEQVQLGSWRAHPLNKALLSQPLSQPSLLLGMQRILNAASQRDIQQQQQRQLLQQLLLPFVSFVLLQPDPQGQCCEFFVIHDNSSSCCCMPIMFVDRL